MRRVFSRLAVGDPTQAPVSQEYTAGSTSARTIDAAKICRSAHAVDSSSITTFRPTANSTC